MAILPLHFSNSLIPNLHLHQFPLLFRPLQVPPSAAESGKRIRARLKPRVGRIELHVPVDTRKEVWNPEKGIEYGAARAEGDQQGGADNKDNNKHKDGEEPRLSEVRMSSEKIPERGEYMLGIVRDGPSYPCDQEIELSLFKQDICICIQYLRLINFAPP